MKLNVGVEGAESHSQHILCLLEIENIFIFEEKLHHWHFSTLDAFSLKLARRVKGDMHSFKECCSFNLATKTLYHFSLNQSATVHGEFQHYTP